MNCKTWMMGSKRLLKNNVIDKLIDRRIETPEGKDLIKVEEAYIPDKEIIKALLLEKK